MPIQTIDQSVLEKIASGDRKALEEIHTTYYPEIRRFIYFRVDSNQQLAEDLASAIFLRFFEYIARGNTVDHIRGFLFRSAKNELSNYYRDRKVAVDIDEVVMDEIADSTDIEGNFDFQLDLQQAQLAIQKLKDEWKDVIIMRFIGDLDYVEIAKITGKSEGAVRVVIHRALKQIREGIASL